MVAVSGSREVHAPLEGVWTFLSDVPGYPHWVDATDEVLEAPPVALDVGYVYREYGGVPPFKGESTWTITEWEPMTRQVHLGDDGFVRMNLLISVGEDSKATNVSMTIQLTPRWFLVPLFYPLWPIMMKNRTTETMGRTLDEMKAQIEGKVPAR